MKKLSLIMLNLICAAAAVFGSEADDITGQVNNASSLMPKGTEQGIMSQFTPGMIITGAVFGAFGVYAFGRGKKRQNGMLMAIGVGLLIYPWFVPNLLLNIIIGSLLCVAFYYKRNG